MQARMNSCKCLDWPSGYFHSQQWDNAIESLQQDYRIMPDLLPRLRDAGRESISNWINRIKQRNRFARHLKYRRLPRQ
jgi:hypothetical protein